MPKETNDPSQMLASIMAASQEQMQQLSAAWGGGAGNAVPDAQKMIEEYAKTHQDFMRQVTQFWSGMFGLAGGAGAPPAATDDKRFAGEAWKNDPWAEAVKNTYLAYSGFLQEAVEKAPIEARTKDQLRFATRQFVDAMSPANFLATNPEALQIARATNGQSLLEGAQLFFSDFAKGRVSTTDEGAFEVGRNIATTPGQVVFENEILQLIQYEPLTSEVAQRPLLMVPPAINKFYILDLQRENSFVRYALERGHPVFMVSWRNVGPEQGRLTWDDYVEQGVIEAIDVALEVAGADRANTLGFCVGGTLLASALGVMAARGDAKVSSVTLLTTMLDFSDTGEIGALISEQGVAAKEMAIGSGGILEGKELAFTFTSLRANDLMWQYVTNSYLKGKAPPAFDMLYWNADSTNLPGPMFCWYVRHTYLENKLRAPGGTVQCGVPVDLSQIHAPAFVYSSRDDHIVPWKTAYASCEILSGDNTFVLGASGHIAGVINHPSKNKRNYWSDGKRDGGAERWLETAQSTAGSWWPRWASWIDQHAGPKKKAPARLGNKSHRPIEAAPGRYVMQKA